MQSNAIKKPDALEYAKQVCDYLPFASYAGALSIYKEVLSDPHVDDYVIAQMGLHDRFFLLTTILNVDAVFKLAYRPEWIFERCREVEVNSDGYLDLWAREHWKSTIITFAGSIQEMAKDSAIYQDLSPKDGFFRGPGQEITIGLFSHNTKIARDFTDKIKRELEDNPNLPKLYQDVFWENPKKQAPSWSRDGGLILKRISNPNEATISGWGLVDGLPTSKHFKLCIYDDVVTEKSVTGPEMILKTTEAWELSSFLSARISPDLPARKWHIGTRYNFADTWGVMLARKAVKPRLYPATNNGLPDGKPVLLSQSQWDEKKSSTSAKILSCQMLQNPLAGSQQEFKPEWVRPYWIRPETLNVAILVDPASSKSNNTSNSAFAVIGMDANWNKYLLDGAYHKMSLAERWKMLKYLRFKWVKAPGVQVVSVGYEKYGMQADIEHFEQMMEIEKCPFPIEEVNWVHEGSEAKDDRIRRLTPDHQNWQFFYPVTWYDDKESVFHFSSKLTSEQINIRNAGKSYLIAKPIKRVDENRDVYNLVEKVINNEYMFFPATTMKDFMDAASRFYDMDMKPPVIYRDEDLMPEYMGDD